LVRATRARARLTLLLRSCRLSHLRVQLQTLLVLQQRRREAQHRLDLRRAARAGRRARAQRGVHRAARHLAAPRRRQQRRE
jgi:hypothetical protein